MNLPQRKSSDDSPQPRETDHQNIQKLGDFSPKSSALTENQPESHLTSPIKSMYNSDDDEHFGNISSLFDLKILPINIQTNFSSSDNFVLSPITDASNSKVRKVATLKKSMSQPILARSERSGISELLDSLSLNHNLAGSLLPPINRYTLRDLNYEKIINNIQIRHDILFEPQLEFIANNGENHNRKKKERYSKYWNALSKDIDGMIGLQKSKTRPRSPSGIFSSVDTLLGVKYKYDSGEERKSIQPVSRLEDLEQAPFIRIPIAINEIKEIILELIPYSRASQTELTQNIDIELIVQQIEYRAFDFNALMKYIASVLKTHCAPARDSAVNQILVHCENGEFLKVMQACFEVLESMKLDIANDQLRKIKPHVVASAVKFEWKHFSHQLSRNRINTMHTVEWIRHTAKYSSNDYTDESMCKAFKMRVNSTLSLPDILECGSNAEQKPEYVLNKAFLDLIVHRKHTSILKLPETLKYDVQRLNRYHSEIQDLVVMSCLITLIKQAVGKSWNESEVSKLKEKIWAILNDKDTTMNHLILFMVTESEKLGLNTEAQAFARQIENCINVDSPLFVLFTKRIAIHLFYFLKYACFLDAFLIKHGISSIREDLEKVAAEILFLCNHNKTVYAPLYNEIFEELQK